MPLRQTEQRLYDELLDRYGRQIAEAFLAAVRDLRSAADLQRLIVAIEAGNVEAALKALHLDPAAYSAMTEAIRSSYIAGGDSAVSFLPALKDFAGDVAVIRFSVRNPRAETWLAEHSATLVTRILDDQRAAVRQRLKGGLERGENPRTTALDIVGRIDRTTGQRAGGVLGLTAQQEGYLQSARAELASGDPALLRNYLARARRDKRFDRAVAKAIETGEPIPADIARKALRQYENRMLALRGEIIGRTESLTALNQARHEAFLQLVDRGAAPELAIRKVWRSAGDMRVRHTHQGLNGETAGLREPFTSQSGARMLFPGDTSMGAPASETIGCRCIASYRIDLLPNVG